MFVNIYLFLLQLICDVTYINTSVTMPYFEETINVVVNSSMRRRLLLWVV